MPNDQFPKPNVAMKKTLPTFVLTEVCVATDPGANRIFELEGANGEPFFERPMLSDNGERFDGKTKWMKSRFNFFPIVLDGSGLPWAEANVYILSRLQ
ncbi:MAG TPA: hypothetical protein VIF60_00395, partial [Burkholderiaceae bacterium]